jgi:hypothetical protein
MSDDASQPPEDSYPARRQRRGNPIGWVIAIGFAGLVIWVVLAYG